MGRKRLVLAGPSLALGMLLLGCGQSTVSETSVAMSDRANSSTPQTDRGREEFPPRIYAGDLFPFADLKLLSHNYRVPRDVPLMKQKKTLGCWATAAAMLAGWKAGHPLEVEQYLSGLDPRYLQLYEANSGLSSEKEEFLKRAGFKFEWGATFTPKGIENLLKRHGPVWFTVTAKQEFSRHATVVIGFIGTGGPDTTYVIFIDPADGREHSVSYAKFTKIYEDVASADNSLTPKGSEGEEGYQIVHYPAE